MQQYDIGSFLPGGGIGAFIGLLGFGLGTLVGEL
jgi:hypothetical protein